jgi:glycosyltransferase involved in cell wall biosynthesis
MESILIQQSLLPDEFVLICDGLLSPELDNVIEKYVERFHDILKVYRLENNIGLGKALNYGLEKCNYEYVARADSDDICAPNRFEKQIEYMKKHQDITILGSDIDEFETDQQETTNCKKMPADHYHICEMSKFRNPMNHMTVVFNREVILRIGSYEQLLYLEDYYLWVRTIAAGYKLANINESLVHARVGNGMIKRRGNHQYIKSWQTLNQYMKSKKMISTIEYYRNMLSVRVFVYMPVWIKTLVYNKMLRN